MREWKAEVGWKLRVLCGGSYVCNPGGVCTISGEVCSTTSGVRRSKEGVIV